MKILKMFCFVLFVLGILFINFNSNSSTNAHSQAPGTRPRDPSSCQSIGCGGYDARIGCTHCPNGENACFTDADCQSGYACDTTYVGSNPNNNSSGFCYKIKPPAKYIPLPPIDAPIIDDAIPPPMPE